MYIVQSIAAKTCQSTLREAPACQNGWIFGKVPNGLWSPPLLIFGKSYCKFFPEFMTKVPFIMAKICNTNFWIGNDPPPFWNFSGKNIRFGGFIRPLTMYHVHVFHSIWPSYILAYGSGNFWRLCSHYKKICNIIFQKRGGRGQRPFGTFPKKHPFWYLHSSLTKRYG